MAFVSDNNRIKLTNIIPKLSEEAVDALYKEASSLLGKDTRKGNPACPYCGSSHTVKNGHKCRKQEYLCKCCGKTYVSTTNTLMANSHQDREVWAAVVKDTAAGYAIDFSAGRLGLSHDCVFHMRHKILMALHDALEEAEAPLGGVSELDETFVPDCYKGSPLPAGAGRPPRKHGAIAQKRGISNEYVCICTGVERKGDAIAGTANRAKPSSGEIMEIFRAHPGRHPGPV